MHKIFEWNRITNLDDLPVSKVMLLWNCKKQFYELGVVSHCYTCDCNCLFTEDCGKKLNIKHFSHWLFVKPPDFGA